MLLVVIEAVGVSGDVSRIWQKLGAVRLHQLSIFDSQLNLCQPGSPRNIR